jgi:Na+/melibiose symporter-like transporter
VLDRWPCRKGLFLLAIGGSRVIWLAIGLIPILWPALRESRAALVWLSILNVLFYFIHSMGASAWMSWMADLVPAHAQGAYWSARQVGFAGVAALARIAFGYYLEKHRYLDDLATVVNFNAYALVFALATLFGLIDALLFVFVAHREPARRAVQIHIPQALNRLFRESHFRRLWGVYLFWGLSNCIMAPTLFFYLRDTIGLGVKDISLIDTFSLLAFVVSLAWGKYSDRHGHRSPLVIGLLIHALYLFALFFAGKGDFWFVAVVLIICSFGYCGINLFMMPMLINLSKSRSGEREITMAAFSVLLALTNCAGFLVVDRHLFHWLSCATGAEVNDNKVYLSAMLVAMLLRLIAAGLAAALPKEERDTPPGALIFQMVMSTPMRAAVSFFKHVSGQDEVDQK